MKEGTERIIDIIVTTSSPNLIKDKNLYVQEHNKQKDPETKTKSHRKIHYQLLKDRIDYEKKKDLACHVVILNSINLLSASVNSR